MITQGYLARHFQGRSGMRDPALLDVAQDYALKYPPRPGRIRARDRPQGRHLAA